MSFSWIGAPTLSLLLKLQPRKLEPWFSQWSFFPLKLPCISINLLSAHAWNTVFTSGLVPLVGTWNCYISHKNGHAVIWNHIEKLCSIIKFSCSVDINISWKINKKNEYLWCTVKKLANFITRIQIWNNTYCWWCSWLCSEVLNTILKSAWF